jgi:hypothetical protein
MITEQQVEMAKKLTRCQAWKEFKAKWDGKSPRKGSKLFQEYCSDAEIVVQTQKKILSLGLNLSC